LPLPDLIIKRNQFR